MLYIYIFKLDNQTHLIFKYYSDVDHRFSKRNTLYSYHESSCSGTFKKNIFVKPNKINNNQINSLDP